MLQSFYNNIPSSPFKKQVDFVPTDIVIEPKVITQRKYVTINEHPLIKNMNKEISEASKNIENTIMSRKHMEEVRKSLTSVYTKCIFIVQQIIKLGEINGENENDLITMTRALHNFNKICYDIYGCR
tara:strand:+ start:876 stop:1256 length:381 start_codon:yes stop_codon:yes gene_type:complete